MLPNNGGFEFVVLQLWMAKIERAHHVEQLEQWLAQLAVRRIGVKGHAARLAVKNYSCKCGRQVAVVTREGTPTMRARPEAIGNCLDVAWRRITRRKALDELPRHKRGDLQA